jgi:hypothetical protein
MTAKNKAEIQLANSLDALGINKDDVIAASVAEFEIQANNLIQKSQNKIKDIEKSIAEKVDERSKILEKEAAAYYRKFVSEYYSALSKVPGVKGFSKFSDSKIEKFYQNVISFSQDHKVCSIRLPFAQAIKSETSSYYAPRFEYSTVYCDFTYPKEAADLDKEIENLNKEKNKFVEIVADTKIKLQKIPMLERMLRGELAKARLSETKEGKEILAKLKNLQHPLLQLKG